MKRAILISGFVVLVLSCNSDRRNNLEAENNNLKATIVLCQEEAINAQTLAENAIANAEQQRAMAEIATQRAFDAQKLAEEQVLKAQEAAEQSKK
jgi:hypothetical protein